MKKLVTVFWGFLCTVLIVEILLSLRWRFEHDSPIMLYIAFLMDRFGYLPYKDFFDFNMPGTYWAYILIGRISGFTDFGFRFIDITILGAILVVTFLWMRKLGQTIAVAGAILFGLAYLRFGASMSLQREYLALVLIIAAVAISTSERPRPLFRKVTVGLFFGLAATIKPQTAIGLLPIMAFEVVTTLREEKNTRPGLSRFPLLGLVPFIGGFAAPLVLMLAYLWSQRSLDDFVSMVLNYWPLYATLSGNHQTITGVRRLIYLAQSYMYLGGAGVWLIPSAIGVVNSLSGSTLANKQKQQVLLGLFLAVAYSIYPVLSGQFWPYHWIPFIYFLFQMNALCFISPSAPITLAKKAVPLVAILTSTLLIPYLPQFYLDQISGRPYPPPKSGRVDEIAAYLQANMKPNDRVQPLDWTGGAVHAMLISRAQLATRFIYDFHFYHGISSPYIQNLRKEFIDTLETVRPRFIIDIYSEDKPWVSGEDTTREFDPFKSILEQEYTIASEGNGYRILEIRH